MPRSYGSSKHISVVCLEKTIQEFDIWQKLNSGTVAYLMFSTHKQTVCLSVVTCTFRTLVHKREKNEWFEGEASHVSPRYHTPSRSLTVSPLHLSQRKRVLLITPVSNRKPSPALDNFYRRSIDTHRRSKFEPRVMKLFIH